MELRGNLRVSHKGRLGAGDRPAAFSPGGLVSGFLILCLGIHGPLSLALAGAWAWRWVVFRRIAEGGAAVAPAKDGSVILLGLLALGKLAFLLATIPLFLVWYRRVYRNLLWWGVDRLGESILWAVGSFFVPFAGYVVPCMVMQETWRGSDPEVDMESSHAWRKGPRSPWIVGWWAAWVVSNLAGGMVYILVTATVKGARGGMWGAGLQVVAEAFSSLAAGFAVAVVLTVNKRQSEKVRQVAAIRTQALLQEEAAG